LQHIEKIEPIVCENESQALIFERDLIRTHKPIYNIKLKDDKAYLLIKIDRRNTWPRLEVVRKKGKDGALYLGPFVSGYQVREVVDLIRRVLPLRTCSDTVLHNRQRPCLEYHIKRCLAPCCLAVAPETYNDNVDMAVNILSGKADRLLPILEQQMEEAAEMLRFELAAALRDKIIILQNWLKSNCNVHHYGADRHAFHFYRDGHKAVLNVIHTSEGRIAHSHNYVFDMVWMDDSEFLESAIEAYYTGSIEGVDHRKVNIPDEVIVPLEGEDTQLLELVLTRLRSEQVVGEDSPPEIINPKRGIRLRLLELARVNAESYFTTFFRFDARHAEVIEEMASLFQLKQIPRRIECLDISNLQGNSIVGAIVVFMDGRSVKSEYRRYNLAEQKEADDFRSVHEVTLRRLKSGMESGDFPDLLVVDGGKGQLGAALAARDYLGLEVEIVSIAKIRDEMDDERVFLENAELPVILSPGRNLTLFMQRVRDEAHSFVLNYHRDKRLVKSLSSTLDELPGIGTARRKRLLAKFGSLEAISQASREDIAKAGRMSPLLADKLITHLKNL
jgi:excinuclease ABC subunit C